MIIDYKLAVYLLYRDNEHVTREMVERLFECVDTEFSDGSLTHLFNEETIKDLKSRIRKPTVAKMLDQEMKFSIQYEATEDFTFDLEIETQMDLRDEPTRKLLGKQIGNNIADIINEHGKITAFEAL